MRNILLFLSVCFLFSTGLAHSADEKDNRNPIQTEKRIPPQTQNWYSWINLMPPTPGSFYVVGDVLTPNPGIALKLSIRSPEYLTTNELEMDLHMIQQPGFWPQVMTWQQVRFERRFFDGDMLYDNVKIFYQDEMIAVMPVEIAY